MRHLSRSIVVLAVLISGATGYALGKAGDSESPLWKADEAFNRSLHERNVEAFASWIEEDAVFLSDDLVRGREEILEIWSGFLDPGSGYTMSWQPHTAVMSRCEDLGYTLGDYVMTEPGLDGGPIRLVGTYLTVWGRGADRAWRVVVDAGTPGVEE